MGVVGCILGFLVVIYLCYKDWSEYRFDRGRGGRDRV